MHSQKKSQQKDVVKVRDVFFKKSFVGFMVISVFCAFVVACASSTKPSDTSSSDAPRVPYTTEQEGAAVSETTAEKIDAHSFVEIKFSKNSSKLNGESKESIRTLMTLNKMDKNKLDQVIVLAWADQEYPSEQKEKLSPKQVDLAKKRNEAISKFVKSIKNVTVETHSMAQQPSTVSDWLNTQDSKIKNSLVAAGLPTSADKMKYPSKASHALIFALRN